MASKKVRIAGGVTALLVVGGVVAFSVTKDSRNRIPVQIQKVGKRDLVSVVSASGEVKPKRFVNVSANVSGRITQLLVKEGDSVRNGQVLARIDSTRFAAGERQSAAAVQAARADAERAEADLEASRLAYERSRKMHAEKLISDQAFEQAQAELKMKEAALNALRRRVAQQAAGLESNRDDLEKTIVVAPMDGVVTNLQKEEGEVVIGAQSFQPTVIMTVGDLSVLRGRGPGGRDRHPLHRPRAAGRDPGGRARGDQGERRGDRDRVLGHPARRRAGHPGHQPTRPRTSRSR